MTGCSRPRRFGRRSAVKRAVADFEFDDIFAFRLQLFRDGEHREGGFDGQ